MTLGVSLHNEFTFIWISWPHLRVLLQREFIFMWGPVTTRIYIYFWSFFNLNLYLFGLTPSWVCFTTQIIFIWIAWPHLGIPLQCKFKFIWTVWPHYGVLLQRKFIFIWIAWPNLGVLLQCEFIFIWNAWPHLGVLLQREFIFIWTAWPHLGVLLQSEYITLVKSSSESLFILLLKVSSNKWTLRASYNNWIITHTTNWKELGPLGFQPGFLFFRILATKSTDCLCLQFE